MNRNPYLSSLLVLTLAGLVACSSQPSAQEAKKTGTTRHQIQGKAQVLPESNAADAALNAGGSSVFLWDGVKRYRLFFKTAMEVNPGDEYIAEGIYAQKAIDEIGDPAQGKNGYPLASSCERVVRMAWTGLAFDVADAHALALRAMVKRYPARAVFLVNKLTPASKEGKKKEVEEDDIPAITVPAEKQKGLLVSGASVQPAPLWEPAGGTARCKVVIDREGKVSALETGAQLCEAVPWAEFKYQPTADKGKPVNVKTEVEVRFDPRT